MLFATNGSVLALGMTHRFQAEMSMRARVKIIWLPWPRRRWPVRWLSQP